MTTGASAGLQAVGEAGKANRIVDEAFDLDQNGQGELVIVQSQLIETAFAKTAWAGTPLAHSVLGTVESLEGIEDSDVRTGLVGHGLVAPPAALGPTAGRPPWWPRGAASRFFASGEATYRA